MTTSSTKGKGLAIDLAPARWIWLPCGRTLPNTFVLFRRVIELGAAPVRCSGWISADSRYRLSVNGARIQWGPAPCDPRWQEADPIDLTPYLSEGTNVIGVEVLYYGFGEGTWVGGKPGLLCHLQLIHADGAEEVIVSDSSWSASVDRSHRPGQYRRWFLRALQEDFDARIHPEGWDTASFRPDQAWMAAAELDGRADKPSSCTAGSVGGYPDHQGRETIPPNTAELRCRSIPLLHEAVLPVLDLVESSTVTWRRDPADWFDLRVPGSFEVHRGSRTVPQGEGHWLVDLEGPDDAALLTFALSEQVVGWPHFTVDAPAGTVVELICQESHDPEGPAWLDTAFSTWSRLVCREGTNRFETFDFESLRWLQLHVRAVTGPVSISGVGVRRRSYPWPHPVRLACSDPVVQRLVGAAVNTLDNSAQDTCVDGMARERAQYSGDGAHQLHTIRLAHGDVRLPERYLRTFSQGLSVDGWFIDCWPSAGRLEQLALRQTGASSWGVLVDHGVGFVFDCWDHYMETGELTAMEEVYPRLARFTDNLASARGGDGLLAVEDLGLCAVWIDHDAYRAQHHKQCAFNLYSAAMFEHAMAPLAGAMGDERRARRSLEAGRALRAATVERFWSAGEGLFVCNLPWARAEGGSRLCDRSLATSMLFDQCPDGRHGAAVDALVACPPEMGLSYPANAWWRYQALARAGLGEVVLDELRTRWASMRSVIDNNTLQETWEIRPDSTDEWSHCPMAPLNSLIMDIAGIRPAAPGFSRATIRPQLGDLQTLQVTAHTPRGPIGLRAERVEQRAHRLSIDVPAGCAAALVMPAGAVLRDAADSQPLPVLPSGQLTGINHLVSHRLEARTDVVLTLPQTESRLARAR